MMTARRHHLSGTFSSPNPQPQLGDAEAHNCQCKIEQGEAAAHYTQLLVPLLVCT